MQLSVLGSVGYLMQANGLQDALHTVYASKAVDHMMSGKEVSRAVRGHLLVISIYPHHLYMMLTSEKYGITLPIEKNQTSEDNDNESVDDSMVAKNAPEDLTWYRSEAIDTRSQCPK